ncbi:DUF2752 domain-containing protein [Penaeicola halotolerans]|uniref:DUF2752 domain-containing protein n=1 Tax=Penaeicola halotolerans TaxID=2793196 RepID=UPI001CF868BC|nr:DUF2752 domain-containing protein [Penaeicola halotolerans]
MEKSVDQLNRKVFPLEAVFWTIALISLALFTPSEASHFSLCPIDRLGFDFCPGCGLGRSMAWAFKGEFARSFSQHWLGIPAILLLIYRIFQLIVNYLKK